MLLLLGPSITCGSIKKRFFRYGKRLNSDRDDFPKPKEIPAMSAVLHDQVLFRSLILCLKSNSTDGFDSSLSPSYSAGSSSQVNSLYTPGSRKRSISFDKVGSDVVSNKSFKSAHGHSPIVGKRTHAYSTK